MKNTTEEKDDNAVNELNSASLSSSFFMGVCRVHLKGKVALPSRLEHPDQGETFKRET